MEMSVDEFKAKILSSLVCSLTNTTKILILHVPFINDEEPLETPLGRYPVSFLSKKSKSVVILCWAGNITNLVYGPKTFFMQFPF